MVQQIQGLVPQKIPNRTPRKEHSTTVPYSIDFGALTSPQSVDLSSNTSLKNQVGGVRSIYVDNSNNAASVDVLCNVTRQTLTWPAFSQGYLNCTATNGQFTISTSGNAVVGIDFFNIDSDNFIWSPSGAQTIGSVLFAGSAGIDHSANAPAYPPAGLTLVASIAANISRALVGVQNQDAAQVQVWRTSSATPTQILLESGGGDNIGGGAWLSQTYKGIVEVWGDDAAAIVSAYED